MFNKSKIKFLEDYVDSLKEEVEKRNESIKELKLQLSDARNLKELLDAFNTQMGYINNASFLAVSGGTYELNLPDTVPVYVEDMLGGKVIKQEATKCVKIDSNGITTTGYTKQESDKGYSYKLIRE